MDENLIKQFLELLELHAMVSYQLINDLAESLHFLLNLSSPQNGVESAT